MFFILSILVRKIGFFIKKLEKEGILTVKLSIIFYGKCTHYFISN